MTNKLLLALHSRTVGVLVIMCLYNVLALYGHGLSPQLNVLVNVVLGAVATYFKVTPGQLYPMPPTTTPVVPATPSV